MTNKIIFIQRRSHRAGAQVALSRLLSAPEMRDLSPLVVVGEDGWLADNLRHQRIDVLVTEVPSVRSVARFWNVPLFANRIAARRDRPLAVIANNHHEAILAARIAKRLKTKSAAILRDSGLKKDTLEKYGWRQLDHALTVGGYLKQLAVEFDATLPVTHLYDSITGEDFASPKPKTSSFPNKALVIGSDLPSKGWRAWIEAVRHAAKKVAALSKIRFDFTGDAPLGIVDDKQFRFIGRRTDFIGLLRQYDLVVNPSKNESFGLAAAETLAAGVPLLSTPTGVVGSEIWLPNEMLMGSSPEHMTRALISLYRNWPSIDPMVAESQETIKRFSPSASAATIADCIERMQLGE